MASAKLPPPKVLLFDIGGVCVVSPFQAILDYEIAHSIPPGYINHTISRTSPNGTWQRIERGEIPLDDSFFQLWAADLNDPEAWAFYHKKIGQPVKEQPHIDSKPLFFAMMGNSRRPDPAMWPALKKLRASGKFVLTALSNTVKYPPGVRDDKGKLEVRNMFDVFISSAHVGLRKPDPAIYKLALAAVENWVRGKGQTWWDDSNWKRDGGMRPGDVVFVDDIGENLKAARALGLRTIKVNLGRNIEAVKELQNITGVQLIDERSRL
ncbi:HAD-like protein [Rhizodiscina lignyota]|uniref:HAD-like protein n=1 Tax=Rhizodiscina lignyota TaxID=1504668 RepID=A0A9P4IAY2_9PEZI|nr:HAD-like protein [Rhizodiscina lignyota]